MYYNVQVGIVKEFARRGRAWRGWQGLQNAIQGSSEVTSAAGEPAAFNIRFNDGTNLAVRRSRQGRPVVLVPGSAASKESFTVSDSALRTLALYGEESSSPNCPNGCG